ncbi:lysozyme inhibitor LprI family protein [Paraburkholderia domus]|uniref:Lysozyme inhibitor LprI-like N-terminal domain-containing protein n=1 Tax=Paraburkholderia domus TaxID=2793075 RepID=A0A9N8MP60_9BURK|nr:lysozyme inhibitor LprI family protein [Paraburkholderia domus]MBK5164988.1 DUF1311 domain-containing protein [Burkholderia sp. R-70211]CAE6881524.1 hypothetical protein R70211_02146 [Paraburkholderia domus]
MMRATSVFFVLLLVANAAYASSSIYGSEFDYKKAKPASTYFSGKNRQHVASFCKKEMLGTMDLSACAQFRYELAIEALNKRIQVVEKILEADDKDNGTYGEPAALPFFRKAQANWELYRDNNCYSDVYSVGQASLRFIDFWDCMTRITKQRLDELTNPSQDD